jgi:hypothetical protein
MFPLKTKPQHASGAEKGKQCYTKEEKKKKKKKQVKNSQVKVS